MDEPHKTLIVFSASEIHQNLEIKLVSTDYIIEKDS